MSKIQYAVIIEHNYCDEKICTVFEDYKTAKAYFEWALVHYRNMALDELAPEYCRHEDEYARLCWDDACETEFILIETSEPPEKFMNEYRN